MQEQSLVKSKVKKASSLFGSHLALAERHLTSDQLGVGVSKKAFNVVKKLWFRSCDPCHAGTIAAAPQCHQLYHNCPCHEVGHEHEHPARS